jgi:hypothetical protein
MGLAMTRVKRAASPSQKRHCEERSDEANSRHSVTNGQIAAPFGLAMTVKNGARNDEGKKGGLALPKTSLRGRRSDRGNPSLPSFVIASEAKQS